MLRGRCLSYGQGITFWPIGEALRELAGVRDDDPHDDARAKLDALAGGDAAAAERAAAAVGLTDAAYPVDELFWGLRRRARPDRRRRPARHRVRGLALGRADDARPGRASGGDARPRSSSSARPATRSPATAGSPGQARGSSSSTGSRLRRPRSSRPDSPGRPFPPPTLRRIIDTAGGNPLFLEQMLAMMQDAPGGDVAVPADDPRAALGPPRPPRRRPARGRRHRVGRRPGLRPGRRRRARARRAPARRPRRPDRPRAAAADPAARRGHDAPAPAYKLPAHPDPRRRLRGPPEARSARELHERFVAWADEVNGDRAERVRGDPRLPPRAGPRLPRGAGTARRPRPRVSGGGPPSGCGRRAGAASRAATCRPPRTCSGGRPPSCPPSTRTGSTSCPTWARR